MNNIDYSGKTVVVTGAASGMGREVAEQLVALGAEVHGLDIQQVENDMAGFTTVNLAEESSIDEALTHLPTHVDSVFACAGVSGKGMPALLTATINFVGHRHLIESLVPRMSAGGSIGLIASMGGMGWIGNIPAVIPLLQTSSFSEAVAYLQEHEEDPAVLGGPVEANRGYTFSKEATVLYAKYRSWSLAAQQIRINTVSPGATQTPMLSQFGSSPDAGAKSVSPIGAPSTPRNQADALLYLNSTEAEYISGTDLVVDYGFSGGIYTGQGALRVGAPSK
ncbi:SDR family oxidoreductase [Arthrobacter sp. W4I7]|uniref:SDR family oxidoreductase n=1 Tax=Arthrobacter sp. W4I7 TaxID=3042296 RepID=UPI00278B0D04|nr:SDR family oxidoreductase [Arthrobacter sp. W4I7]MDQ0691338.1 NAD(P)-dependent dehydrogenase (short-subunit alcohol dehydrogenase family) [Arthrobacter sp. W4I7]